MRITLLILLLFSGVQVKAAQKYLVFRYTRGSGTTVTVIPMETEEQCQIAGAIIKTDEQFTQKASNVGFSCIEGQ